MQIEIPDDAIPEITRRAAAAGYADLGEYILTVVLPQSANESADPLVTAIDDGFSSGLSPTPLSKFLQGLRQELVGRASS